MNYNLNQIAKAEKDHNPKYKMKIKISGEKNSTNWMDISQLQLEEIKNIFRGE